MTQHYTKLTQSASAWCAKCKAFTQHRVDEGRKGPCIPCMDRYDAERAVIDIDELRRKLRGEEQQELFA